MAGGWAIFWRQFSVRTYLLPVVQRTGGLGGGSTGLDGEMSSICMHNVQSPKDVLF